MRVKIDGNALNLTVLAVEEITATDWTEKTAFGSDEKKTSPDGKQLWTTRKSVLVMSENGVEKNASFTVLNPEPLAEMTKYRPSGQVYYTPYVANNGRLGDSLIFEKLVPIKGE